MKKKEQTQKKNKFEQIMHQSTKIGPITKQALGLVKNSIKGKTDRELLEEALLEKYGGEM